MSNPLTLVKLRKLIASISLTALVASLLVVPTVTQAHWADPFRAELGDPTQEARYADSMNKCEFSAMLTRAFDLEQEVVENDFTDVPEWCEPYVGAMMANNIAEGRNSTTFGAADAMPRGEAFVMVARALGLEDGTVPSAHQSEFDGMEWAMGAAGALYAEGIVTGDDTTGNFRPFDSMNRAEGFALAGRAAGIEGEEPPVTVEGDLEASLASDSPSGLNIPKNATSVEVLAFNLKSDKNVTVNEVVVSKTGVSTLASDFQGYIYVDGQRLTSGKGLTSDTRTMSFRNLGLAVGATPVRVSLRVDIGATASSGDVAFAVTSVTSTAATVGGLPVQGASHGLSTTPVGTVTIEKNGSITNPKVGEDDVTVAKFKVTAATEDAMLKELGLYLTGTVSTDAVENWELYAAGTADPVATATAVNSKDVATFVFATPYELKKGDTRSFEVKADFNTGRTDDTVQLYVDEATDVLAVGGTYGYGMAVTMTGYDGGSCTSAGSYADCSNSTLEGGDVTISSNGPAATEISVNGDDVVLMNFNITSVSEVTFKNFGISLDASESGTDQGLLNDSDSDSANFTDIKIVNTATGATLMGPVDVSSFTDTGLTGGSTIDEANDDANEAFYLFTDEFVMEAGESLDLAITTDVKNDTDLADMTLVAELQTTTSYPEIRDVNNKIVTNSSSLVPTSEIAGKTMTVASPGLTFALASTPVSDTFVKGSQDVTFACFSVRAGSSSDVLLTDLTLTSSFDDEADGASYATDGSENSVNANSIVGSVRLTDGAGNEVAGYASVATAGTVTYSDVNHTFAAGETQLVCVEGDISSDAFKGGEGEKIAFGINAASDVTAEDNDGNTLAAAQISGASTLNVSTTAPTVVVTVSNGGTLTVDVDPATAKEDIAVAGTSDMEISKFKFTSTDEPFVVSKLAIQNRHAVTHADTSTVGAYDNNVVKVRLDYTDKDGAAKTAEGILTNGNAQFAGLSIYVPKDDDTTVTVSADLNTVTAGAQAGEFVDLNVAFNNFEAIAQGSGRTYKPEDLDDTDDDGSFTDEDLVISGFAESDFVNTVTYTNDAGDLVGTTTLGGSTSFKVDNNGADQADLPVGTLLCMTDAGADTACDSTSDDIYVVTAWTDGSTEDTVTATLINNEGDGTYDAADEILYALPGQDYLTAAKRMHVYESKPTATLNASSPSGSRSVSATDNAFMFDVTASTQERVQWRTAKELATCAVGVTGANADTVTAAHTTSGEEIDGSACRWNQHATANADDSFSFDAGTTGVVDDYTRASFWIRSSVANEFADISYATHTAAATAPAADNTNALAASDCTFHGSSTSTTMTADTWYFCDVAVDTDTDSSDQYFHFLVTEVTELNGGDNLYVDRLVLYNDKIEIDLAGDDIDTQANSAHGLVAYLKEGGSTLATGYVAKKTSATAEGGNAKVVFYPISGTDPKIEIAKGTTKSFTVQLDTSILLAEDAGADDPLTFSIDLGSDNDSGTSLNTAGDIWWNDTNFSALTLGNEPGSSYALSTPGVIKWLGHVANTTLTGNTVKY